MVDISSLIVEVDFNIFILICEKKIMMIIILVIEIVEFYLIKRYEDEIFEDKLMLEEGSYLYVFDEVM